MSVESNTQSGGISVLGILGIVFVTLKLCGVIDWSWWWVTAPFWGAFALALGLMLITAVIALIAVVFSRD